MVIMVTMVTTRWGFVMPGFLVSVVIDSFVLFWSDKSEREILIKTGNEGMQRIKSMQSMGDQE
jgi:hypothetical protein